MAIIRIEAKGGKVYGAEGPYTPWFPEGAHSYMYNGGPLAEKDHCTISYSHVGLCLYDFERNGYDDSDFYMVVWDEAKQKPVEICFASTRGWSYPAYGSKPDATPEVRAAADAWAARERERIAAEQAEREALALAERDAENKALADLVGCAAERVQALRDVYSADMFPALVTLLKTRNFRSTFRANCAKQIREWLMDPAPMYARPLSPKQAQYI